MSPPSLSVIVVTYRREQILCDTLAYLLALDYLDWELIVVDQSPHHEPSTEAFLDSVASHLQYIRIEEVGMCHARNVGIHAAQGDILVFFDDDIIPSPDILKNHARHYVDPGIGGVTGPVHFEAVPAAAPNNVRPGGVTKREPFPESAIDTDAAYGGNVSYRRRVLVAIGEFDEGYIGRAHREDTDVSLRVRAAGYRVLYDPDAKIEHLTFPTGGSRTHQANNAKYTFSWYHNNAYFFAKHMPIWQLPIFLRYQLGLLLYRQVWRRRRLEVLRPAISGLFDGFRKGRAAGHAMRALPVYART